MKKSALALILAVLMAVGLLTIGAAADDPVAKIGEKTYDSLAEAISQAVNDDVITLLKDYDATNEDTITFDSGKKVTLNLGNNTLTIKRFNLTHGWLTVENGNVYCDGQAFNVYAASTEQNELYTKLVIKKDVTINAAYGICLFPGSDKAGYSSSIEVYGNIDTGGIFVSGNLGNDTTTAEAMVASGKIPTVTIYDGAVVNSGTEGQGIAMNGLANVTVDGGTITGREAIGVKRGTLTVNGGTFTSNGNYVNQPDANHNGTEATGATISITSTYNNAGTISVSLNGGSFTGTNAPAVYVGHSKESDSSLNVYAKGITLNIAGGTFSSPDNVSTVYVAAREEGDAEGYTQQVVTGGNFSGDVSTYVHDGMEQDKDGNIVINEETAIATVDDSVGYTTLEAALAAAKDGQTVTLLEDVTLTEPVVINTGITLDLGGKTVTIAYNNTQSAGNLGIKFTSGSNELTNGIIIDERSKDNTTYSWVAVAVQAPAELETSNVTIASYIPNNDAGYNYPLRALNTDDVGGVSLTLNSGTKITEYNQAVTDEGGTYGTCGVTVFGANKVEDPAVLVINEGVEITSTSLAVAGNGSSDGTKFTINGGKLTSTNATAVYVPQICEFTVHGGTITGVAGGVQFCGSGSVTIDGGTLIATGEYTPFPNKPGSQSDGSADDGAALSIVSRGGGYQAEGAKIDVNITGGEFISRNNAAISVYRLEKDGDKWNTNESTDVDSYVGALNVDGGIFKGGEQKGAFEIDNKAEDAVTVSKGSFSSSVAEYVTADFKFELNNNGTFSYYKTAEKALANAEPGAVIKGIGDQASLNVYSLKVVYGNGQADYSVTVPDGIEYTLPTVSKPGYIFMGWKCSDGHTHEANVTVTITGNVTFTAVWANMPDVTPGTPDDDDEPVVPDFPFTDVREGQWFYEAVKYVYSEGIMNGMDRYTFDPNGSLTRAMVWTMLARHEGVDTENGANWYAKAQEWAVEAGVSDGTDPMGNITREQLVTMLWRLNGSEVVTGSLTGFTDYDKVSDWAGNAMLWATVNGIIEGDEANALNPTAGCTRAQAAAMIMRFCAYHEADSFGTVV